MWAASAAGAFAQAGQDLQAEWPDSTTLRLRFTLAEGSDAVGSNYAVCATPYLYSDRGDTLQLQPSVFRGKRNQRYTERARYYGDTAPAADRRVCPWQCVSLRPHPEPHGPSLALPR